MGHAAKIPGNICDVSDELELAISHKNRVRVVLEDGTHRMGLPQDIFIENNQDFLRLQGHLPVPLASITRVEKL